MLMVAWPLRLMLRPAGALWGGRAGVDDPGSEPAVTAAGRPTIAGGGASTAQSGATPASPVQPSPQGCTAAPAVLRPVVEPCPAATDRRTARGGQDNRRSRDPGIEWSERVERAARLLDVEAAAEATLLRVFGDAPSHLGGRK